MSTGSAQLNFGPTHLKQINLETGMVFQNFNLFSHKTVLENVSMPVHDLLKKDWNTAREEAMELLHETGDHAF